MHICHTSQSSDLAATRELFFPPDTTAAAPEGCGELCSLETSEGGDCSRARQGQVGRGSRVARYAVSTLLTTAFLLATCTTQGWKGVRGRCQVLPSQLELAASVCSDLPQSTSLSLFSQLSSRFLCLEPHILVTDPRPLFTPSF